MHDIRVFIIIYRLYSEENEGTFLAVIIEFPSSNIELGLGIPLHTIWGVEVYIEAVSMNVRSDPKFTIRVDKF